MKKVFCVILLLVMSIAMTVKASSPPYMWTVATGMPNYREDVTKINNAAVLEKNLEDGKKEYTLKLTNYNGPGIELECRGTGQSGMKFIIELTGENVITDESIGINYEYGSEELEFTGTGSLTINAPTPISNKDYKDVYTIDLRTDNKDETEETTKQELEEDTKEEVVSVEPETKKLDIDNNMIIYIVAGLIFIILLVIIMVLSSKINKMKKEQKTKEGE